MKNTKQSVSTSITGCSFVGVQFDATAVDAISTIATGLVENAKALGALAAVLKSSNVNLECMLRVDAPQTRAALRPNIRNLPRDE